MSSIEGETIVPSGKTFEESFGSKFCLESSITSQKIGPSVFNIHLKVSFIWLILSIPEDSSGSFHRRLGKWYVSHDWLRKLQWLPESHIPWLHIQN